MYFHLFFDTQQLVQSRAEACNVGDVEGAVDLPTFSTGPYHPAEAQRTEVP
jgi:hypothetical protein